MAIQYKLVLRKDMSKGAAEDAKLYYAQTSAGGTVDFSSICENIASRSTASRGDVMLVLDGFIYEIKRALQKGEVVRLDGLGSFQAVAGSKGALTEEEFNVSLMKQPKIIFRPSLELKQAASAASFQRMTAVPVSGGTGGGEEERPGEL